VHGSFFKYLFTSPSFHALESRGQREGLQYRFSSGVPRLNLVSRSDAVVVYDNPSERTVKNAAERIPSK